MALLRVLFACVLSVSALGCLTKREARPEPKDGTDLYPTIHGSGVNVVEERGVPSFTKVKIKGDIGVMIHIGKESTVKIHGDDNLVTLIATQVTGDTLGIGMDYGDHKPSYLNRQNLLYVEFTVPRIDSIDVTGGGEIRVDKPINQESFSCKVQGLALIRAHGKAKKVRAELRGPGEILLNELVADDVEAHLVSNNRIIVHANKTLTGSIEGPGKVIYTGRPKVSIEKKKGGGDVRSAGPKPVKVKGPGDNVILEATSTGG